MPITAFRPPCDIQAQRCSSVIFGYGPISSRRTYRFWSLSFEAAYYVAIALFVFAKGYGRLAGLILLSLLTGPTMVLLAPTWLLGYVTYHFSKRRLNVGVAAFVWLSSLVLLLSCFMIEESLRQPLKFLRMPDASVGGLLAAYAAALCFSANVVAFNGFSATLTRLLQPFQASSVGWVR
jgi:hypothetical protein